MALRKTLDFTKTRTLCGDVTLYILEEVEANPDLEEIEVIHHDAGELEEAAKALEELGWRRVELRREDGRAVLVLRKS